jgi:hypothetical protein
MVQIMAHFLTILLMPYSLLIYSKPNWLVMETETKVDFVQICAKKEATLQIPYPASQQYGIIISPPVANGNDEKSRTNMTIATMKICLIILLLKNNKVVLH